MRLEDEIQVNHFRNPRHKLMVNLIYTYNWMVTGLQKTFREYGLTMQQYNILRILRGRFPEPSSIQTLKSRMLDKQPDVSRLIDRLHSKNLVDRQVCNTDRRKMDVLISEAGLELLAQLDDKVIAYEDMFHRLNDEEVDSLNEMLDRMRESAI